MQRFREFIEEGTLRLNVGDWIMQDKSGSFDNVETYGVVLQKLKRAGNYSAIIYKGSGKGKKDSIGDWNPQPVVIDKSKVPAKAIQKIEDAADRLNITLPE